MGTTPTLRKGNAVSVITTEYAHLSTTCECETEEGNWAEDCYGCYEDNLAYLKDELLGNWLDTNGGGKDHVRIDGKEMGWTRESGFLVVEFESLVDALKINGEYTLRFMLENNKLTAMRTSHDEPMGAFFNFTFVDEPED
jgi:hypothetical protein